jgi:hypothetical protein
MALSFDELDPETRTIIGEIARRVNAGEPVGTDLLRMLPVGGRLSMPVTIGFDGGREEEATIWIHNAEDGPKVHVEKHRKH